jgi:sulfate permease, SulP family
MSLVVAALATAMVAVLLTPLFRELPEATLAAIVIVVVSDMERIKPIRRLWSIRPVDAVVALVALFGVLIFDILPGLAIAVVMSLGVIIWRAGEPRIEILGDVPQDAEPDDVSTSATSPAPGLILVRPEQMMFFVNAIEIRDAVIHASELTGSPPDVVLLDLGLTPDMDVPSCDVLTRLQARLGRGGTALWLATPVPRVRERLDAAGLTDKIGADNLFMESAGAVLSYLYRHSGASVDARHVVLDDILHIVKDRAADPGLDEHGRAALHAVEARIEEILGDGGVAR